MSSFEYIKEWHIMVTWGVGTLRPAQTKIFEFLLAYSEDHLAWAWILIFINFYSSRNDAWSIYNLPWLVSLMRASFNS